MLLDNDEFLKRLDDLFKSTEGKGTVFLIQKRYTHGDTDGTDDVVMADEAAAGVGATAAAGKEAATAVEDDREHPCLLRATDGKEVKVSTLITAQTLPTFHAAYSSLLRTHLTACLRKRDKRREKKRAEAAALRAGKKATAAAAGGEKGKGLPKRGNGRRKRVREENRRSKKRTKGKGSGNARPSKGAVTTA